MKKNIIFITIIIFINFIGASPALAQTLSLSLWPPLLEATMQPGRSITAVYKLTNNSDRPLQITPQVYPFEPQGSSGQIKLKSSISSSGLPQPLFSFESGQKLGQAFALPQGETKELVLKIATPKELSEKDYYYTLLFSTAEVPFENQAEGGKTGTISQIGSNLLITVSHLGQPALLGTIVEFSAPKIIDSFSAAKFNLVLENRGKNLWKPFGEIAIESLFKEKSEVELLQQNVLSYSSRQLNLELFRPKIPFGPFKAKLSLTLNEEGPSLSSETTFWYFPYKALGIIFVLVLTILLVRKITKKGEINP